MDKTTPAVHPPVPFNEQDRLEALYKLQILDSDDDNEFDRISHLARRHFDVPVALISLIDKDRQWFKSCIGIDEKETSRDVAFCSHTILHDDVMVVPDATKDARFENNPLVTGDHHIRFYAGAPIKSEDGYNLGTICIIDTNPRDDFNEEHKQSLLDYAGIVSDLINAKKDVIRAEDEKHAKSEFLSYVSHELRTPLNAIIGLTKILRQKTTLDTHSASVVRTLAISADSLLELVNSVLDLSAVEARNFTLSKERFSFAQMLEEITSIMGARAAEKNLTFTVDYSAVKDKYFEGDKVRLKQVLLNLLSNAIKFTNQGAVTLKVAYKLADDHQSKNMIEFQVIDSGIGIPKDKQAAIFGRFEQAHAKSHYEGTGLGLAITKDIVEKMDGDVRFESHEGFGTKFFVTIPDSSLEKPLKKAKSKKAKSSNGNTDPVIEEKLEYNILVAEDYAANATVIEYILQDFGYNSTIVTNGQAVLDALETQSYDLILMDINMPVLSGVETTEKIRENPAYNDLPIIAMSAHVFEQERQECLDAGMDDYITKPMDTDILYDKLKHYLADEVDSRVIKL